MDSHNQDDGGNQETHNDRESDSAPTLLKLKDHRIRIPSLQERLLVQQSRTGRLLDFLKARPSVDWFKSLKLSSPLAIFRCTVDRREEISMSVPSPVGIRRRLHINFIRRINCSSLFKICKDWLKHPMNIALLIWLLCVAASATMLGLLMLGLLNKAFPTKSSRNHWIEINNQILNALFTLMSLYQHPNLFHHLVLLCRWSSEDIVELRKIYCKNGAYRPHEWAHMMVVVILLHITCLAQYALCGLYWGFSSSQRPELAEDLCFAAGIGAPVFAGAYVVYSPLGRDSESSSDEESQTLVVVSSVKQSGKTGLKLLQPRIVVSKPEWAGGLFDCGDDMTVGYLSFFCTFCVFGWNMERLGFGNMYVHMFTFLLLCVAPFWIFNIAALNIHNYVLGDVIGITGIVLCVFGLLYGGFWRRQMRKRFKLPRNRFCCGSASLTDYLQWMFCWSCSLAQEVRTGNFYDVQDDSLYRKLGDSDEESQPALHRLAREDNSSPVNESELPNSNDEEETSTLAVGDAMVPPVQPLIQIDDRGSQGNTILIQPCSQLIQRTDDPFTEVESTRN